VGRPVELRRWALHTRREREKRESDVRDGPCRDACAHERGRERGRMRERASEQERERDEKDGNCREVCLNGGTSATRPSCVPAPLCIGHSAVGSSAQSSELTSLQSPSLVCASAPSPCRVCVSTTYLWKHRTTPET